MNKLSNITRLLGCELSADLPDRTIVHLLTDSRSLSFPDETLFVALYVGGKHDGHDYIPTLYERGVRAFVVERDCSIAFGSYPEGCFIPVASPLAAMQLLAASHRADFSIPVVGITGSRGKTIVKEWLFDLLGESFRIVRSPRSYNSQVGVPLSVWQLESTTELAIFEAGISRLGEMERIASILRPTIGIFTNIDNSHQTGFDSIRAKCVEKMRLFDTCSHLILCIDQPGVVDSLCLAGYQGELLGWSYTDDRAALYISQIDRKKDCSVIHSVFRGNRLGEITIPYAEPPYIENAIHCLALLLHLSIEEELIADRMSRLPGVQMRLEVKEGYGGSLVVDDSYTLDFDSLTTAIDFFNRRTQQNGKPRTLILSDFAPNEQKRLGTHALAELLRFHRFDRIVGVGSSISEVLEQIGTGRVESYLSTESLLAVPGIANSFVGQNLLIKGARWFRFEEITKRLLRRVHETTLEVNLEGILHNYLHYRSLLRPSTMMTCMVKAFGYGAGSLEIARTLEENGCDYLAVALADEGAELREAGITMPILVMNPESTGFATLFRYNLEPEVYSFRLLRQLHEEALRENIMNYPIHLKFDTGMKRLGFEWEEVEDVIGALNASTTLRVRSCFTHLAGSDSAEFDEFTHTQYDRFMEVRQRIEGAFSHRILFHLSNTAAMERFPEMQLDMTRLGIGLYGVSSSGNQMLQSCITLRTTILQIREVQAGESIGYGRRTVVDRVSRIATVPIGYADGLNRRLSNGRGSMWVSGQLVPIVGNICMDTSMINITGIDVREGDSVVVFGELYPIERIAEQLDTIPYEVLTSISSRVKRVYYRE